MEQREMKPAILFEYDRITDLLMNFGQGLVLKLIVDIGESDKDNNKTRSYNEFRYPSNKYANTQNLVTAQRKFRPSLAFEYKTQGSQAKSTFSIREWMMEDILAMVQDFDEHIYDPFTKRKSGELIFNEQKNHSVMYTVQEEYFIGLKSCTIINEDTRETEPGVVFTINGIDVCVSIRLWKQFLYLIKRCDLYGWGSALVGPYTANVIGMGVSNLGGLYNGSRSYERVQMEDPDELAKAPRENPKNTIPVTSREKKKSFFDQ